MEAEEAEKLRLQKQKKQEERRQKKLLKEKTKREALFRQLKEEFKES